MRLRFWQPAGTFTVPGKGEFPQKFAPHSWDSQIGKVVPFKVGDHEAGTVRLVAAEVAEDGSGVALTIETMEIPDEWWGETQERPCAMCGKVRPCTLVGGPQPGFPEGEWMCRECLLAQVGP